MNLIGFGSKATHAREGCSVLRVRALHAFAVVGAAALACASGPPLQVADSVYSLHTEKGVCAGTGFVNMTSQRLALVACMRNGAPGTPFDNGESRLITILEADGGPADLTDWQVLVLRDGEKILNRELDAGPSHRRCGTFGTNCRERAADVVPIPGGAGPGSYTIRYRLMSEEAYLAGVQPPELKIDLH
jgi:hypothetical protein